MSGAGPRLRTGRYARLPDRPRPRRSEVHLPHRFEERRSLPDRSWVMAPTMIIAWTGHRPGLFADPEQARRRVEKAAGAAAARAASPQFLCGGQRGVDLWAAEAGLALG